LTLPRVRPWETVWWPRRQGRRLHANTPTGGLRQPPYTSRGEAGGSGYSTGAAALGRQQPRTLTSSSVAVFVVAPLVLGPPKLLPHTGAGLLACVATTVALDCCPSFTVTTVTAARASRIEHCAPRRRLPPAGFTAARTGTRGFCRVVHVLEQRCFLAEKRKAGWVPRAYPDQPSVAGPTRRECLASQLYTLAQMILCVRQSYRAGATAHSLGPSIVGSHRVAAAEEWWRRVSYSPLATTTVGTWRQGGRVFHQHGPAAQHLPHVSQDSCLGRSLHDW